MLKAFAHLRTFAQKQWFGILMIGYWAILPLVTRDWVTLMSARRVSMRRAKGWPDMRILKFNPVCGDVPKQNTGGFEAPNVYIKTDSHISISSLLRAHDIIASPTSTSSIMTDQGYLDQPDLQAKAPFRSALLTYPGNLREALRQAEDPSKTLFGVAQGLPSVFATKVNALDISSTAQYWFGIRY